VETVWVALAGMIVFLDTTAVAQSMICQPIIACPLFGILAGRPEIGLFFGVTFQLLFSGTLPVGAAKFAEGNVGALIATAVAVQVPPLRTGEPAWLVIFLGVLVGVLVAQLGKELTPTVRRVMNGYAPRILSAAMAGRSARFSVLYVGAIGINAVAGFAFTGLCFLAGKWILSFYVGHLASGGLSVALAELTDNLLSGLWPGLLGVGVAVFAHRFLRKSNLAFFAVSAAIVGGAWLCLI
jgi:mannose/fructose/N-acetylgalactosamine-specific phosphotransferase system component IIC